MLIVPFNRVVPESEKISELDKPGGWESIGELPGMFNWAIEGLRRLRRNGRFTKSKAAEALKLQYRADCNPAQQYLEDHCRELSYYEITKRALYDAYRAWCINWGYRPASAQNFAKEVRRSFPNVGDIKRRGSSGGREWSWTGITMGVLDEDAVGDPAESSYYANAF